MSRVANLWKYGCVLTPERRRVQAGEYWDAAPDVAPGECSGLNTAKKMPQAGRRHDSHRKTTIPSQNSHIFIPPSRRFGHPS
ncbi:hypothetical protein ARMSODRAFT_966512 [Armillaria solidipes]|uniref:Uncharacterized protein n=1 Tax=Armillaria solidipes TaxID=1076256 RepID=A0A2H3AT25_9AGAR|nr:hypothetical protein ARMSODRAFT_966512 [Armillaria solidipes]